MRSSFSSIRTRLILLALGGIIPLWAFTLYSCIEHYRNDISEAKTRAFEFAKTISGINERMIQNASQILFTLSQIPEIREKDEEACQRIFSNLMEQTAGFTTFAAALPDGSLLASAPKVKKDINYSDRYWFKHAFEKKGFVIGEHIKGRISGKHALALSYPVLNSKNEVTHILFTGLDLEWLQDFLKESNLPRATSITLYDRSGNVFLRHPALEQPDDKSGRVPSIINTMLSEKEGVEEATGLDGIIRIFGFTYLGIDSPDIYISVGIPKKVALEKANRKILFSVMLASVAGLFALLAARYIGNRLIYSPVKALLDMTKHISNGDLSARSGFLQRSGELGELSEAFDIMACSLQKREEEKQRAEETLRQAKEHFRILTENALDLITVLSPEGTITYQSPSIKSVLGYEPEDVMGKKITDFIHSEDVRLMMDSMKAAVLEPGSIHSREIRIRHSDGTWHLFEGAGKSIIDESGALRVIITSRDITMKKSLENQLIQAQKLEALGRLTGGVAHDFNNMLTAIIGYADLMLMSGKIEEPVLSYIEEIKKAGERASSLTNQLLAFSRKQLLKPEVVDLNRLIKGIETMLKRIIGEDIEIHKVLDPELGRIKADPTQIEQVIMNLAVNARDAMPDGGKLTIETKNIIINEEYKNHQVPVQPGNYVLLTISDTGEGMDPETQSHMFEPFFTTKETGKGTGLGLSTVYGIVKQSGGYIWVHSEPGRGSTFRIFLPSTAQYPVEEKRPAVSVRSLQGNETILLIEDEESVRNLVSKTLKQYGYNVLNVKEPLDAINICEQRGQEIDLLITDVVMPGIGGQKLAEKILELHPGIKVLYISGYTDNIVLREGIIEHGINYLQKPFNPSSLALKVREVLDN